MAFALVGAAFLLPLLKEAAAFKAQIGAASLHTQVTERASSYLATASHRFSPFHAEVLWIPPGVRAPESHLSSESSLLDGGAYHQEPPVRILHITDNHISIDDPDPPRTTRMYNAFIETSDFTSESRTSPKEEFISLLRRAKKENVDLIALGGDLVNYPSKKTVSWVMEQLRSEAKDIPFIYTAGNHDWHEEGSPTDQRYDSARLTQLNTTLRPLFKHSVATADKAEGPGAGLLYGKTSIRGTDVFFVDNSNFQVSEEQLQYLKNQLEKSSSTPAVLLMHMPLKLADTPPLEPKYLTGHPAWGADSDDLYQIELRPQWPKEGNSPSTLAFIELVQKHSAPVGRLAALLTGHVHKDFSSLLQDPSLPSAANLTALSCTKEHMPTKGHLGCQMQTPMKGGSAEALGALQYSTLDAAEGGYRLLTIRSARPHV